VKVVVKVTVKVTAKVTCVGHVKIVVKVKYKGDSWLVMSGVSGSS